MSTFCSRSLIHFAVLLSLIVGSCKKEETVINNTGDAGLTDPNIKPAVKLTIPANGSVGPYSNLYVMNESSSKPHFALQFNKLMNVNSFTSARVKVEGFDSSRAFMLIETGPAFRDLLTFSMVYSSAYPTYKVPFQLGKTYVVTIDSTVEDINGNHLSEQYRLSFQPEPYFRVTSVYPANGTTGLMAGAPPYGMQMRISFNSPVRQNIISSIQLTPQMPGRWIVGSDSTLVYFSPDSLPVYGTTYTMKVETNARDKFGNQLRNEMRSTFSMAEFKVMSVRPYNSIDTSVTLRSSLEFRFSGPVDTATFRSAFAITPAVIGTIDYSFSSNPTTMYFTPRNGFAADVQYTASVGTGVRSTNGTPLSAPFTYRFTTPSFGVSATTPADGEPRALLNDPIRVTLNAPSDTSTVRSAFRISPTVPGVLTTTYYSDGTTFTFTPTNGLAAGTTYSVTVDTTIRSKAGSRMNAPYRFTFATDQFKVQQTNPTNGATNVSQGAYIAANFNAPIDTSTVRAAFSITPNVQGIFAYDSYYSSEFSFRPTVGFQQGIQYTVVIRPTMKSKSGSTLGSEYRFRFTTAPFVISNSSPQDGATNVSPYEYINIVCNGAIDTGSARNAFSISPSLSGTFTFGYSNQSYFEFRPRFGLAEGVTYTVTISTAFRSKTGSAIEAPYSFSFTTRPFRVNSTSPTNGQTEVNQSSSISLSFTSGIDTAGFRSAFTISPPVSGSFSMYSGTSSVSFYPTFGFRGNTTYTVTLGANIRSQSGGTLGTPYSFSFTTRQFGVTNTEPTNGATNVNRYPTIIIYFSSTLSSSTVQSAFRITPSVAGSFSTGGSYLYFSPNTQLASNTDYSVTIGTSLRSSAGDSLATPYTFGFRTGN